MRDPSGHRPPCSQQTQSRRSKAGPDVGADAGGGGAGMLTHPPGGRHPHAGSGRPFRAWHFLFSGGRGVGGAGAQARAVEGRREEKAVPARCGRCPGDDALVRVARLTAARHHLSQHRVLHSSFSSEDEDDKSDTTGQTQDTETLSASVSGSRRRSGTLSRRQGPPHRPRGVAAGSEPGPPRGKGSDEPRAPQRVHISQTERHTGDTSPRRPHGTCSSQSGPRPTLVRSFIRYISVS